MPGNKGRMGGGWTDEQTGGRVDGRTAVDGGGRADERTGADEQTGGGWEADGRMGGMADGRMGGMADGGGWCRTDFPKGKTPNLTHQLTWPSKIQRGLSPPSQ